MSAHILVVDDEPAIQKALSKYLLSLGYHVECASAGAEAIEKVKSEKFNLVISDQKMPQMNGLELMRQLKNIQPGLTFIIMTGHGTIETAIEAVKAGAFHYVTKPFELDDVGLLVAKALQFVDLLTQNTRLKSEKLAESINLVGVSPAMKHVFALIEKVSMTDASVLVLGESGTGKEKVAKALHYSSKRATEPFVAINCGAIPEGLLESELFGYVKGAFTGANQFKDGKFVEVAKGSLFLDEIGDMTPKIQAKLLRVLQEKRFEPIGSSQSIEVEARIIAASNRDLEDMMKKGKFRDDLYYRLNVIPIVIPPLRERREDIPMLVRHFLNLPSKDLIKCQLSDAVQDVFLNYKWPGNVRELENTLERLCVLKPGQIVEVADLPESFHDSSQRFYAAVQIPDQGLSLKNVMEDFENSLIEHALDKTNGNKNKAAKLLRLNRTTLVEKLKKKNLAKHLVLRRESRSIK